MERVLLAVVKHKHLDLETLKFEIEKTKKILPNYLYLLYTTKLHLRYYIYLFCCD